MIKPQSFLKRFLEKVFGDKFFSLTFLFILTIGLFFRTYNYLDRISVVNDNSRDAIIGLFSKNNFLFPQIGAFSQAPFFFGPWWYWIMSAFYYIPFGALTPWYIVTFLSIVFIALIAWVSNEIGGKSLALITAFFSAISTVLVTNSLYVWNPTIIPLLTLLVIIFCLRYIKKRKSIDIFAAGFFYSLAVTIHFQTALIAPTILIALIVAGFKTKHLLFLILAISIPVMPFIYFDLRFNWFESKRIIYYFLIGQHAYYVPNRWLTFLWDFWPKTWAGVLGANEWIARLLIASLSFLTIFRLKEIKKYKFFYLLAFSFVVEIIIYRYFGGQRYDYYNLFTYPSILILTSWVIWELLKTNKFLGCILLLVITLLTLNATIKLLNDKVPVRFTTINNIKKSIYNQYRNDMFDVYGIGPYGKHYGLPLAYLIYTDNRSTMSGIKVGIYEGNTGLEWQTLDVADFQSKILFRTTAPVVFSDVVEWWKKDPPKRDDDQFWEFVLKSLNPKCYPKC